MPRPRFTIPAMMLAVSLLAAGCGGGQQDASEEPDDARADGVSEVATSDGDQPDTTVRESAEQTEQPDADTEPEPEPAPVRLGSRFMWCFRLQADWDRHSQAQAQFDDAEAALLEAREALATATDELDRAEAQDALDDAERRYEDLTDHLADVNDGTSRILLPGREGSEDTETIALGRAREVFRAAADPAVLELSELAHGVDWSAADLATRPADAEPAEPAQPAVTTVPAADEPATIAAPAEDAQTGAEALSFEDTLAAIEEIQGQIDVTAETIVLTLWEMDDGIKAIGAAEHPSEVMAARQAFTELLQSLDEASAESYAVIGPNLYETQWPIYEAFWYSARDAVVAGELSSDEFLSAAAEVEQAVQALTYPAIHTEIPRWARIRRPENAWGEPLPPSSWADDGLDEGTSLADIAFSDAASASLLADTAGMIAFWASLSGSCEP